MPSFSSMSAAPAASCSSEPVPMRIRSGAAASRDGARPGRDGLVSVAGPDDVEVRKCSESRHLLDRLVSRPIFADRDGVVCPDEDDLQAAEGGQADGTAHVVAEDEECRRIWDKAPI